MATNGLTIAAGTADIEISDSANTYGYKYAKGSQVVETRGSAFVGQIATGGTTYQDAEPFKRKVYDNFLGGMGQESDNKTFGGTGVGGDDTKYFYGDCYTLRGGYLLPGMARNLVYNTITAAKTPIADGLDPLGGDEQEVPRGVVPVPLTTTEQVGYGFTTISSAPTITNLRVLVQFVNPSASGTVTITAQIRLPIGTVKGTYALTVNKSDFGTYTGWKWITLPLTSGTGALLATTGYNVYVYTADTARLVTLGCCIGAGNAIYPYCQLMTSATPFKYWATTLAKMEQVNNSGTYANIAITNTALFNTAATATAGTAGTSPERTLSGTWFGSIVFNNTLYISTVSTNGTAAWSASAAATNAAPTNALDANVVMFSPVALGGYIYFADANRTKIQKWNGNFPATAIDLTVAGTIGHSTTKITNLFVFQGNLWVVKPEGLFQLYADPAIITTDPGNTPRIVPVVTDLPSLHDSTGLWLQVHQGMIFFNYRDRIYQVTYSGGSPAQVTVLSLPMPWYRLSYYHAVNGITSDGVNLYVSWNNLGVFSFTNQTWHPITEFYELINYELQYSGLRWFPNPTAAPDNLFVGDGRTIVQLPAPSAAAPYTSQIFQNHQNKCGYVIFSAWDGELAEVQKYIHSLVMRAVPSGYSYKVVPVVLGPNTTASFNGLIYSSWQSGLGRDNWVNPTNIFSGGWTTAVATTQVTTLGAAVANTLAPACWTAANFNNTFYSAEKLAATTTDTTTTPATTDVLTNPPKFVKTAFIIYFWNPTAGQHATSNIGADLMAVDSLVVKYLPPLDYIASYQVQVDLRAETIKRTNDQIDTDAEQLRQWSGAHQPVQVTMKLTRSSTKTFLAFLQNPTTTYGRASEQSNNGGLVVKGKALTIISVQAEYGSV